jgi:hypothetical protein
MWEKLKSKKEIIIEWAATAISIAGAICVSLDYYPLGAIMCFLETGLWLAVSIQMRHMSMITSNAVLLTIYVSGMSYKHFFG